ncbi:MAG TPA: hypothetical protein VNX68_13880, partial [Nitrosopumilaceae archaeon]|nr:hypothetical protein [Nitrosopumilaceae archaeon]
MNHKNREHALFIVFFFLTIGFNIEGQILRIPKTPKIPSLISYCKDTSIIDNYRWLENSNDTLVRQWFNDQGRIFEDLVNQSQARDSIYSELQRLDHLQKESITNIQLKNNHYFFIKEIHGEHTGKLVMREGKNGSDVLLYDPTLSFHGHNPRITFYRPSLDASKIAFGIDEGGGETSRVFIMEVSTKTLYKETIYPVKYGIWDWTNDNKSFFYTKFRRKDLEAWDFALNTQ